MSSWTQHAKSRALPLAPRWSHLKKTSKAGSEITRCLYSGARPCFPMSQRLGEKGPRIWEQVRKTAASSPGGGLRHNIQRAYEVLRRRCRAPTAYGLCSPKAILLLLLLLRKTARSNENPLLVNGCPPPLPFHATFGRQWMPSAFPSPCRCWTSDAAVSFRSPLFSSETAASALGPTTRRV